MNARKLRPSKIKNALRRRDFEYRVPRLRTSRTPYGLVAFLRSELLDAGAGADANADAPGAPATTSASATAASTDGSDYAPASTRACSL
jgi:hypothetical protein